jgi:hypothetical protein
MLASQRGAVNLRFTFWAFEVLLTDSCEAVHDVCEYDTYAYICCPLLDDQIVTKVHFVDPLPHQLLLTLAQPGLVSD